MSIYFKKSKLKALPSLSRVREKGLGPSLTWGSRDKNLAYVISFHPPSAPSILSSRVSLGRFNKLILIYNDPRSALHLTSRALWQLCDPGVGLNDNAKDRSHALGLNHQSGQHRFPERQAAGKLPSPEEAYHPRKLSTTLQAGMFPT